MGCLKKYCCKTSLVSTFSWFGGLYHTSCQCSGVLDSHRLLLLFQIRSVWKKVHLSGTDAVPVRNWRRFLRRWKMTFAVQKYKLGKNFYKPYGCIINMRNLIFISKMCLLLNYGCQKNNFWPSFCAKLRQKQKKNYFFKNGYWNWKK